MAAQVGRRIVSGFLFQKPMEIDKASCFVDDIYQHETLAAGFGSTTMVIANEAYGGKNTKDELKEGIINIRLEMDAGFKAIMTEVNRIETKMDAGFKATQMVIVEGAESTMKALKGNTKPMGEFLKKAEKYLDCVKSPEDAVAHSHQLFSF
ncbi:hypothetical protein BGX38DRAFT_179525 [Terfezia claveryi]|nr:hypothetical protein BGX38DRAFT_179525 [Terfezia claveryi]